MKDYKGTVYEDGVATMIQMIRSSPEPIVLLAIAPCPNIQLALQMDPCENLFAFFSSSLTFSKAIVHNTKIIAMGGSLFKGYNNKPPASAEYNIQYPFICSVLPPIHYHSFNQRKSNTLDTIA
jgi:inosine-uridine nucleoside N-ribohydrolase